MAKKTKFDITAVIMATAGGAAATAAKGMLAKKVKFLEDKPMVAALLPLVIGSAGQFFAPDKYKPVFYGMMGASGSDIIDATGLLNGFSRVNYEINGTETPLKRVVAQLAQSEREMNDYNDGSGYTTEEIEEMTEY